MPNPRKLRRALPAMLALAALTSMAPAVAETVTVHDPSGDTSHHLNYDITRLRVQHKAKRIVFELEKSGSPYYYNLAVDLPGPKPWKYRVIWSVYTPRKVYVENRRWTHKTCVHPGVHNSKDQPMLRLVIPRSCLGTPQSLRVKASAWDDEFGWSDRTRWTHWAHAA